MKQKLWIWILLCPMSLWAQQSVPAAVFFAKALAKADTISVIESERLYIPWVESYDLRLRTNDFNISENIYTFRIAPSTPQKRKAQQALSEHLRLAPDFEQQEAFCDLIYETYRDWLSLYLLKEEQKILLGLDTVLQDKRILFEKMATASDFDLKEWIKLQTDESDLAIALSELELDQERLRQVYGLSTQRLDFGIFIDPESIQDRLLLNAPPEIMPQDQETAYEKELLSKKLALEVAESRQIFDFAQVRYQGPQTELFRERLSLGLGFRIPNSGNRRLKIQELELKQKALAREQARDETRLEAEMDARRQDLLLELRALTYYQQTVAKERQQLQQLSTLIMEKEGSDPLLLLEIEERHLKTRMKAFEKWQDILMSYLRYEQRIGRLCRQLDQNVLEKSD